MEEALPAKVYLITYWIHVCLLHSICRNRIPWAVIAAGSAASAVLLLILRAVMVRENKKRDQERAARDGHDDDRYDAVYIVQVDKDGKTVEKRVDKVS